VSIYINFCIFVLSALNKILFPCVSNYGSKGRDAVKTPFLIPFYSIQYIKTVSLPLQYCMLLIMYGSLLITARLLVITARLLLITELHKVTGYEKVAHVTPVSIPV
jgi:uncharacterized membrane protein YesL